MLRAGFRCEACGDNMKPLEWAHLAGRGNIISEPWCSTPELTAGLCSGKWGELGCHERVDRALSPDLLNHLRSTALHRLALRYEGFAELDGTPLDSIRRLVNWLELDGWEWDAERQEIVKA
jgi:hypothetical protein